MAYPAGYHSHRSIPKMDRHRPGPQADAVQRVHSSRTVLATKRPTRPHIFSAARMPDPTGLQLFSACLIFGPAYCKAHVTHIERLLPRADSGRGSRRDRKAAAGAPSAPRATDHRAGRQSHRGRPLPQANREGRRDRPQTRRACPFNGEVLCQARSLAVAQTQPTDKAAELASTRSWPTSSRPMSSAASTRQPQEPTASRRGRSPSRPRSSHRRRRL